MIIYVVHEITGSHVVKAFMDEQDAKSFLNWSEYEGTLLQGYYKVDKVELK